jgi:predicted P-loop ATPase
MSNNYLQTYHLHSIDTIVSYYDRITKKENTQINLGQIIELVKNGGSFKDTVQEIRTTVDETNKSLLKKTLPAVTISGQFINSRNLKELINHSGFLHIDFDKVDDLEKSMEILKKDLFSFSVFLSPSGNGIKVLVKISNNKIEHSKCFKSLEKYYQKEYDLKIDPQCKDITRAMFLSYDPDIFVNENSEVFEIIKYATNNIIERCIEKVNKTEDFIIGNRNNYIYKLALEFNNQRVSLDDAANKIIEICKDEDIGKKEIIDSVNSAYKEKNYEGSLSLLRRTENYLSNKYDIRLNIVSNCIEIRNKNEDNPFKELNENNLFRELQHANLNIPQNKLNSLLLSDFVEKYNPFELYFEGLGLWYKDIEEDFIGNLCKYIPTKDSTRFENHFRKMLVRSIACALEDKVFNKQVFVFVGAGQNTGKSTFCRWLCPPFLSDYITEYINTDKDGLIVLATNFLINMDELATLSKTEINSLKSLISKDKINVRLPFARRTSVHPRRANFIGSTNNDEFLTDETGSVRWLCFEIEGTLNFDYKIDFNIDDIWRQAYALYKEGFEYQLTPSEIKENEISNNKHLVASQELHLITEYFELPKENENSENYTSTQILNHIQQKMLYAKLNLYKIGKVMTSLGYEKATKYRSDKGQSIWGYKVKVLNK